MSDRQDPNGANQYPDATPEETKQFSSADPFANHNGADGYSSAETPSTGTAAQGGFDSSNPPPDVPESACRWHRV